MLCTLLLEPALDSRDFLRRMKSDSELKGWPAHTFAPFLTQCLRILANSWQAGPEAARRFIEASARVSASASCQPLIAKYRRLAGQCPCMCTERQQMVKFFCELASERDAQMARHCAAVLHRPTLPHGASSAPSSTPTRSHRQPAPPHPPPRYTSQPCQRILCIHTTSPYRVSALQYQDCML